MAAEEPVVVRLVCQVERVEEESWVEVGELEGVVRAAAEQAAAVWEVEVQVEAETAVGDSEVAEALVAARPELQEGTVEVGEWVEAELEVAVREVAEWVVGEWAEAV